MDNVEQNSNFCPASSGINQFHFNVDHDEAAISRSNVPSILPDMMPVDSGNSRGITPLSVMFPTSVTHGIEFSDYQQLQSRGQLPLNVEADLSAFTGSSQSVMVPSSTSRIFLSSGMDFLNRVAQPDVVGLQANQGSRLAGNMAMPQGLPPAGNIRPDQRFLPGSVGLLPNHSHSGQQLIQPNCAVVVSEFNSLNQVNLHPSVMSTRLSSDQLPVYRNVSLTTLTPLSMLNFQSTANVPQRTAPETYQRSQVTESGVDLGLRDLVSHSYASTPVASSGNLPCVPATASQSYRDVNNKRAATSEQQNGGLISLPESSSHHYQQEQQIGSQQQKLEQRQHVCHQQQQQLGQHQNQQQQLNQQQQQISQQQLNKQAKKQLRQQQHQAKKQQKQLSQLQPVDPEMCKPDPSEMVNLDQKHNPSTSSSVPLVFGGINGLEAISSDGNPSPGCMQASPLEMDKQQPGSTLDSSSGSPSKVFYHKTTGKSVQIPSGNEAAATSSQNDPDDQQSSLMENSPTPGPSQSYSSQIFEPLSPPDSTTNIAVGGFLDPSLRSSSCLQSPQSSTRQQSNTASSVTYKEDNDGVSSTSEDNQLDMLMRSKLQQNITQQQQQLDANTTSQSNISGQDKAKLPGGMKSLGNASQSSPKADVSMNDDPDVPSSSGILHPSEYEAISDEEEMSVDRMGRHRLNGCRALPAYMAQQTQDDSLVSSCENPNRSQSDDLNQMSTSQQFFGVDLNQVDGAEMPDESGGETRSGSGDPSISHSGSGLYPETEAVRCSPSGSINLHQDNLNISKSFFCSDSVTDHNIEPSAHQEKNSETSLGESSCQTGVKADDRLDQRAISDQAGLSGHMAKEFQSINIKHHQDLFSSQNAEASQRNSSITNASTSGSHPLQSGEEGLATTAVPSPGLNEIQFLLKKGDGDSESGPQQNGLQFINKKVTEADKACHSDQSTGPLPAPIENDVNLAAGMKAENVDDDAMSLDKLNPNSESANFSTAEEIGPKSQDHSEMSEMCSDPEDGEHLGMHNLGSQLIRGTHNDEPEPSNEGSSMTCVDQRNVLESTVSDMEEKRKNILLTPVILPTEDLGVSESTIETQTGGQALNFRIHIEDSQCIFIDGQRRWKCLLCPKMYTSKHNLVSHILDHNGIKPFHCNICGKYFKQAGHLYQHILTHGNIKPYMCKFCDRCFTQGSHLKRHLAVHMEKRPNICTICDRGFIYPSELKLHMEKHAVGLQYPCDNCGDSFNSAKKLKQHLASNHGNVADLTCKECGKVFPYPSQLRDHMVKHSGKRPFQCGECGTCFLKEHHLKAHQFTHTGLRPFVCEICSRAFNQKANLQRHLLIHQNERNYKCEVCSRSFSQPQVLKAHMVTHAEDKPYQCDVCGKKFTRVHNLNGHLHTHKGTKPHVCFCGASFTLKGNLNRHKKEKHGITDITKTTEEEAAKILNEMSSRKVYDGTAEADGLSDSCEGTPLPKKKRKSLPPRKTLTQIAQDTEVEAFWDENPATSEGNTSTTVNHIEPTMLPMTTAAMETFTTDVINKLMGSMTGEYAQPGNQQVNRDVLLKGSMLHIPISTTVHKVFIKSEQDNGQFTDINKPSTDSGETSGNLIWHDRLKTNGEQLNGQKVVLESQKT